MVVKRRQQQLAPPPRFTCLRFSPGIFTVSNNGQGLAWAINSDGTVAQPAGSIPKVNTRPAKAKDGLFIYANGLGPVDKAIADGPHHAKPLPIAVGRRQP